MSREPDARETGETPGATIIRARTADGVDLALHRLPASGERRGVVLCTHAMMASSSYLRGGVCAYLARRGLDVFALDWRGHGRSRPPSPRGPIRWCFDHYAALDLPAAVDAVCGAVGLPAGRISYLGHSLGGQVGLAALATGAVPPLARVALAATSVWLPGPRGPWRRRALMALYRGLARAFGHAPVRRLRFGSDDENPGYVEQLTGWARTGRWTSRRGLDYMAALGRVRVPVWAMTGAGDRLCGPDDAAVLLSRLSGALPLRHVARARGDALDPDHFTLLTDDRLAPVWDQLATFLAAPS